MPSIRSSWTDMIRSLGALIDRRAALETVIGPSSPAMLLSESFSSHGADLFAAACENELEGIVSKRMDLPCACGRSEAWLKTKCVQEAIFVVIGYQPSESVRSALDTAFSVEAAHDLQKCLDPIGRPSPAIMGLKVKGAKWKRPELRVDVNFRAKSREGLLRHASFKGIRED